MRWLSTGQPGSQAILSVCISCHVQNFGKRLRWSRHIKLSGRAVFWPGPTNQNAALLIDLGSLTFPNLNLALGGLTLGRLKLADGSGLLKFYSLRVFGFEISSCQVAVAKLSTKLAILSIVKSC